MMFLVQDYVLSSKALEYHIWTVNILPTVRLRLILETTLLKLGCIIQIEQH